MDYSATIKNEIKEYGLSAKELAFVDLVSLGWEVRDAYFTIFNEGLSWQKSYLYSKINEIKSKKGAELRATFRKDGIKIERQLSNTNISDINLDEVTKENTLKELVKAKNSFEPGTKEWLDIQKQIIEVTQMKKDEVKEEDKTVHYYLPLRCSDCPLYIENMSKKKKGED